MNKDALRRYKQCKPDTAGPHVIVPEWGIRKPCQICLTTSRLMFSLLFLLFSVSYLDLLCSSMSFAPNSTWDIDPFPYFIVLTNPLSAWHSHPQAYLVARSPQTLCGKVSRCNLTMSVMMREELFPGCTGAQREFGV